MFFTQFKALCDKMNTTPTTVVKKLGYSSNKVTAWKHGSIPNLEVASKIAQYFNVSTDYLLTGEEKNTAAMTIGDVKSNNGVIGVNNGRVVFANGIERALSEEAAELLRLYDSLDVKRRMALLNKAFELDDEKG